jgi:hypothetical protein
MSETMVQDCELPVVEDGPESPGRVRLEIGYGHFSRQQKGDRLGEEAEEKQQPSESLQNAGQPGK